MVVGRDTRVYHGETMEELHLKVTWAWLDYVEMGFAPRLSRPTRTCIVGDSVPGYTLRPRPELNPTIYAGKVSGRTAIFAFLTKMSVLVNLENAILFIREIITMTECFVLKFSPNLIMVVV